MNWPHGPHPAGGVERSLTPSRRSYGLSPEAVPASFLSHSSLRGRFRAIRTDSGQFPAVLSSALSGPHLARFVASPL